MVVIDFLEQGQKRHAQAQAETACATHLCLTISIRQTTLTMKMARPEVMHDEMRPLSRRDVFTRQT